MFWLLYVVLALLIVGSIAYFEFRAHRQYYIGKMFNLIAGKGGLIAKFILWMKKSNRQVDNGANEVQFITEDSLNSACFTVMHNGRKYKLFLPYLRNKVHDHINKTIYLVKGETKLLIPHPPGFKFQVNAARLGGDSIVIVDNDTLEEAIFAKYQEVDH